MNRFLFIAITFLFITISCTNQNKSDIQFSITNLKSNTKVSLRGLFVVNENVIWASGSNGTVLKSNDGGTNWTVCQIPGEENNDFRSIHAWDENNALVFGVAGPDFGFKTTDGGKSWKTIFSDTTGGIFFNSLKFADENNGLAVSDPVNDKFFIIKTDDKGITWKKIEEIPFAEKGEANFAASNTCIEFLPSGKAWIASGGMDARVFYSEDFGETWQAVKTPIIRGQASAGIFSISFSNENYGTIVGGIYDQPEINQNIAAYTIDGGKTWLPAQKMPKEYRSCVQQISFDKSHFSFAIGKTGCDYSFDTGINWNFIDSTSFYTFRQVQNKPIGFASGANGKISRIDFNF